MATVESLVTDARGYTSTVVGQAVSQLNTAIAEANGLGRTIGGAEPPRLNITPTAPADPGEVPQANLEAFRDPGLTARLPTLRDVPEFDLSGDPGMPPSVLGFDDPGTQPTGDPGDPALLQGAPEVNADDLEIPEAPDLLAEIRGIIKPTITPITIPPAPTYQEPTFLGQSPDDAPPAPANLDAQLRAAYQNIAPIMRDAVTAEVDGFINREFPSFRTGLAAIETRLATYLEGGTALTGEVQDAILARGASKSDAEFRRNLNQVAGTAAKMGHTLIGPTIAAQLQEAQNARHSANAAAVRDLMIKMAEMEQQNLQFAVTQSANLRATMLSAAMQYYSGLVQINGQALQYATAVVDAIVKVYDIQARRAEIQARIYESEATVYQAKVRGALGAIEAYTAEIRGLEAQANVDRAQVETYKAGIDAVQAEATVYRAEVDGRLAKAQMLRLLVDIYQARVSAYGSQVNAWVAQWTGYKAAVEGQTAGIAASAEQVRAFEAQSRAYGTVIEARSKQIEGINRTNAGLMENYRVAVEAYKARVGALSEVQRANLASAELSIRAFVAKANAISEKSKADIAYYEAGQRAVVASFEMYFRLLHEGHDLDVERVKSIASLATSAANIYGGVAQAAGSGMNTLISQVRTE